MCHCCWCADLDPIDAEDHGQIRAPVDAEGSLLMPRDVWKKGKGLVEESVADHAKDRRQMMRGLLGYMNL